MGGKAIDQNCKKCITISILKSLQVFFSLSFLQVIFVSKCCLFCVLSDDVNVSKGTSS